MTEILKPDFDKRGGLLPVIVQEWKSGEVLMLGYANEEAWLKTLETGKAVFWSTSRNCLWLKGDTSGDFLEIRELRIDCDADCLLYKVELAGDGVCHTYNAQKKHRRSCFYRKRTDNGDWFITEE